MKGNRDTRSIDLSCCSIVFSFPYSLVLGDTPHSNPIGLTRSTQDLYLVHARRSTHPTLHTPPLPTLRIHERTHHPRFRIFLCLYAIFRLTYSSIPVSSANLLFSPEIQKTWHTTSTTEEGVHAPMPIGQHPLYTFSQAPGSA